MKTLKKLCVTLLLFVTFLFPLISETTTRTDLLENMRGRILFPELNSSEKRVMAEQAQIFLRDLYVHRYQKMDYYPDNIDPVPAVAKIVENIESYSTEELEKALYKIFVNQRDLHLNYIFPAPYKNYTSFLPFTLTRTSGYDSFFEVRVQAVNSNMFAAYAPDQRVPAIGDRVITYDNLPVMDAVNRQMKTGQGANLYGGFSRALGQMTWVRHLLHLVPENNSITITFEAAESGEFYTITLPWLVQWQEELTKRQIYGTAKEPKVTRDDFLQSIDLWQDEFNSFIKANGLEAATAFPEKDSNEPVIKWGIIENEKGRFAYLKITSFVPVKGTDFAINEIIRLVNSEFEGTDGMIIDVRNNGGGNIVFADKLSQLFIPHQAKAVDARLLNTDLNRQIFNESKFNSFSNPEWTTVINDAKGTGNLFTETAPFTYVEDANAIGQVYYKPVVVFNNARSYSATDLFSCEMQDNKAAVIMGEDPKTGAGGANVIEHSFFYKYVKKPFEPLPKGHRMRVSWRQSIRFGDHEGELIEDYGCSAHLDVSKRASDLKDGGKSQLDRMTSVLCAASFLHQSSVDAKNDTRTLYLSNDELQLTVNVVNTDYIKVTVNGKEVETIPVFAYFGEENVTIDLPPAATPGETLNVTLEGVSLFNQTMWNMKRKIITLEEKTAPGSEGIAIDFSTAQDVAPLTIINTGNPAKEGWNLVAPYLQIGYDPEYANRVDTDAVLALDLSDKSAASLSFGLEFDTEIDYDFVEVSVTDNYSKTILLRVSGKGEAKTYTYDLSDFAGKETVIVRFNFTSDTMVIAPGVKLSNISVK